MLIESPSDTLNVVSILGIPYGNGVKLNSETSFLIEQTSEVCANCLNGDNELTKFGANSTKCNSLKSEFKGLNNIPLGTCSKYE